MPLVEVGTGVVLFEVIRVKHTIGAEESSVRAGSFAIVKRVAISVVKYHLEIVAHGLFEREHKSVVPGVNHAELREDKTRSRVNARCVKRYRRCQEGWSAHRRGS